MLLVNITNLIIRNKFLTQIFELLCDISGSHGCKYVEDCLLASIALAMMEAGRTSEKLVYFNETQGAIAKKAGNFTFLVKHI
jgi:hypothetical protein